MSPKKTKRSPNEKKIDKEVDKLKRKPLYPYLNAEKENKEFFSSDDSPKIFPYNHSPRMPRKSNSPSSANSMQDIPDSPKRRSGRHQQNQMNNFQDSENSDVDMETDNFVDTDYLHNQGPEKSEISPDFKFKEHLSPKSDRCENSTDARRRRLILPEMQSLKTEPSASTSNSSRSFPKNIIYLILLCIILFICFLLYWTRYPGTPYMNDRFNASTLVNSLKSEFKDQPPLTFRIIHSALRNVLEVQPNAPAIILLLATNGSETVCSEFALRLVDSLSVPQQHTVKISGKDYKQANTNRAKLEIDEAISKTLKNHVLGSVLIDNLDEIPGKAAMILHKYYDHENAPFKKAVFVMTVNYNKAISDYSDPKVWDKAANDHLLSVWTDIGVDQATPLLARLTVSVSVITV